MYYVIFTALGTFLNVVIAIAIDQCVFKKASKAMQTVMIIPVFISYAAVQFIVYAYLSTDTGILNNTFNIATRFYSTPKAWPWILFIVCFQIVNIKNTQFKCTHDKTRGIHPYAFGSREKASY